MRSVDLAIYADALAAEACGHAARLERCRARLRRAAMEQEARDALPADVQRRLEGLGLLVAPGDRVTDLLGEIERLRLDLAAIERLQAWVEAQLAAARSEDAPRDSGGAGLEEAA